MRIDAKDLAGLRRSRNGETRRAYPRREREIQRAVLDFLRTIPGIVAWKTGGGLLPLADGRRVRMGHRGVSDIVGWIEWCVARAAAAPGCSGSKLHHVARFLAIEVKQPGKHPTDEQAAFLDAVRAAGGIAVVATSVEDVASALGLTPTRRAGR